MQLNIQCIRNKLLELEHFSTQENVDVICISEHWLTDEQVNSFIPNKYAIGDIMCRKNMKNGGVGIFLKETIKFIKVDVSNFCLELHCELTCIKLVDFDLTILSVYRSPIGDVKIFLANLELLIQHILKLSKFVAICGDFNIEMNQIESSNSKRFSNLLRSLNLICANTSTTRGKSCIDNVIVNFSANMFRIKTVGGCFADHEPLVFQFLHSSTKKSKSDKGSRTMQLVRRQNDDCIDAFVEQLKSERWNMIEYFQQGQIDEKTLFDDFFQKYINLWQFNSPLVSKKSNLQYKKGKLNWYTDNLRNLRDQMMMFYSMYKNLSKTNSPNNQNAYKAYLSIKKLYNSELKLAKKHAFENYITRAPNRCKAAWEVISHENSPNLTKPVDLNVDSLNDYFIDSVQDIGKTMAPSTKSAIELLGTPFINGGFEWEMVTPGDVKNIVSNLSNSKTMDFYWISNYILKRTIDYVSTPFAFCINECLKAGHFPDLLKISKVVPVYKKGEKSLPQNYRPISIVPVFSKVFESLIYKQINAYFEHNNILSDAQFGFRERKSTTSAILNVIDKSLHAFENRQHVSLTLFDLTKAFDCVPYDILLDKLEFYGIKNKEIKIIKSYLTNRKQYVSVAGKTSTLRDVKTGVPQGSVLGPLLFLISINDLPKNVAVDTILYADDTTLLVTHKDLTILNWLTKEATNSTTNWFSANRLKCNLEKTQNILLSLSQNSDNCVKLLGFHIDSKLSWRPHIENTCRKVSRVVYLIWKLRDYVNDEFLRSSYFSFFQSHISYGILVWGHSPHVQDILLLQKRVIRTICRAHFLDHCRPLFVRLQIMTVINLYIYNILLYAKSNLDKFERRLDIHGYNTRNKLKLEIPMHRLNKTNNSYKITCIRYFNELPLSSRFVTFNRFKSKLQKWMMDNPYYSVNEFLNSEITIDF